jgi:hypothetical protein
MNRQLLSVEDTFLWLSKGDLTAETKTEIVAVRDELLTRTTTLQKYYTERWIVNADSAYNMTRQ